MFSFYDCKSSKFCEKKNGVIPYKLVGKSLKRSLFKVLLLAFQSSEFSRRTAKVCFHKLTEEGKVRKVKIVGNLFYTHVRM